MRRRSSTDRGFSSRKTVVLSGTEMTLELVLLGVPERGDHLLHRAARSL
jgi:hypothetical protein